MSFEAIFVLVVVVAQLAGIFVVLRVFRHRRLGQVRLEEVILSITPGTIFVAGQQLNLKGRAVRVRVRCSGTIAYCTRTGETILVERGDAMPADTVPLCEVKP
jgi:hypothetical protein